MDIDTLDIHQVRIPRGLTNILQPAEVGWFEQIERKNHSQWRT